MTRLSSKRRRLDLARAAMDADRLSDAAKLLHPYVKLNEPEALALAACFSRKGESTAAYERRHIRQLRESARRGYAPAIYQLGAYHDYGDYVEQDQAKAAAMFKDAADRGHAHSQWIHAMERLYGLGHHSKDVTLGLEYLKKSVDQGFVGALESVARFHETGAFGFVIDPARAADYRRRKSMPGAIGY